MYHIVKHRRGTAAEWEAAEEKLHEGELGIRYTDDNKTNAQIIIGGGDGAVIEATSGASSKLPQITEEHNGKVLTADDGNWAVKDVSVSWSDLKDKPFYDETCEAHIDLEDSANYKVRVNFDEVFNDIDYFTKVSENTPTIDELIGGVCTITEPTGIDFATGGAPIYTNTIPESWVVYHVENELLVLSDKIAVCYKENAVYEGKTFPETGIYFGYFGYTMTTHLGYVSVCIKKLDIKYLPDDIGGCEIIEAASIDELPEDAEDGTVAVIPLAEFPSVEDELPEVTEVDNGKILKVKDGVWGLGDDERGAEVVECVSLDELPDDAEDGTIAVIPLGELPSEEVEESELPEVTDKDDGKVLGVEDGEWKAVALPEAENPLPEVTADDAGKVLTANEDGTAEWKDPTGGEGVTMVVNVTRTNNGTFEGVYSSDKSISEILEAYDNGKRIVFDLLHSGYHWIFTDGVIALTNRTPYQGLIEYSNDIMYFTADNATTENNVDSFKTSMRENNELPESTEDDSGKVLTVCEDGTAGWKEPTVGNANFIFANSVEELPDPSTVPENTVGLVPSEGESGGTGGNGGDTTELEQQIAEAKAGIEALDQRVEGNEESIRDLYDMVQSGGGGTALGLPVVELTTMITYCNENTPSTTTILSKAESTALSNASQYGLPVVVKWAYDSLFTFGSLGNNFGDTWLELGFVYQNVKGVVCYNGEHKGWEFRLTYEA